MDVCLEMDRTSALGVSTASHVGFWSALSLDHRLMADRSAPP